MTDAEQEAVSVRITGLDPETFERIRVTAKRYGALTDAAVCRFAIEQFVAGKSLSDFEQQPIPAPQD